MKEQKGSYRDVREKIRSQRFDHGSSTKHQAIGILLEMQEDQLTLEEIIQERDTWKYNQEHRPAFDEAVKFLRRQGV